MNSISLRVFSALLFCMSLSIRLPAQETLYSEAYRARPLEGVYRQKSLDAIFGNAPSIQPQLAQPEGPAAYLAAAGRQVILFKNPDPKSPEEVTGVLTQNSFAELLEIHYTNRYRDRTREWYVSFEVWQKVRINGEVYYTDIKLHDLKAMKVELPQFDQTFLLMAQRTGYDDNYDIGYPEHFRAIVLNGQQEVVFQSKELPVKCNCEFWVLPDELDYYTKSTPGFFQFTIPGLEYNPETKKTKEYSYIGRWNGRSLSGRTEVHK